MQKIHKPSKIVKNYLKWSYFTQKKCEKIRILVLKKSNINMNKVKVLFYSFKNISQSKNFN